MVQDNVIVFPLLQLKHAWREGSEKLRATGIKQPLLDARLLLQYALDISYEELLKQGVRTLSAPEVDHYGKLIARRMRREPVSVITGIKHFWKYSFSTTKDTLDPRPDSEVLLEALSKHYTKEDAVLRVLDLGLGTGCLLLSVLMDYPKSEGVGVDISKAALAVAKKNAEQLGVASRVNIIESEWFESVEGVFDIILLNPPYISIHALPRLEPEVRFYDPELALVAGNDGLDAYREIIPQLSTYLAHEGRVYIEIGEGQQLDIQVMLDKAGLQVVDILPDLSGIMRCMVVAHSDATES